MQLTVQSLSKSEDGSRVKKEPESEVPYIYKIKEYEPNGIAETLAFMLIRPPRFLYNEALLQPSYKLKGKCTYRVFEIPFPLSLYTVENMEYVVLYLHGNSSSRFEGYMHLSTLPENVGLACFDFAACGLRDEGEFITLGKRESKEVDMAARFLKQQGYKVVGWGRSMGSVSLLMSQEIDIMICDSPFSSLSQVCKETSSGFLPGICCCFFHCFYPCVEYWIRSEVEKRSGMDPAEMEIKKFVQKLPLTKSILFMAGEQDGMIQSHHSSKLYEAFKGEHKKLIIFDGSHNSSRPRLVLQQCYEFIQGQLKMDLDNLKDYLSKHKPIVTKQVRELPKLSPLTKLPYKKRSVKEVQLAEEQSLNILNTTQKVPPTESAIRDLDTSDNCEGKDRCHQLEQQSMKRGVEILIPICNDFSEDRQYYSITENEKENKKHEGL